MPASSYQVPLPGSKSLAFSGVFLWRSRLRIQHCHCSGLGRCGGAGLLPGLGTSVCRGCGQKKKSCFFIHQCPPDLRRIGPSSKLPAGNPLSALMGYTSDLARPQASSSLTSCPCPTSMHIFIWLIVHPQFEASPLTPKMQTTLELSIILIFLQLFLDYHVFYFCSFSLFLTITQPGGTVSPF